MIRFKWILILCSLGIVAVISTGGESNELAIRPIPKSIEYDHRKAELGKLLFFDANLSEDRKVSCSSCHNTYSGADTVAVSTGINGKKGKINSPTVFNAYFNFRQMWNGNSKDLADQVRLPIHNPIEMGMNSTRIEKYLKRHPIYSKLFRSVYGGDATFEKMRDAIAEFEKALITPDSRFDQYLRKETKLSKAEMNGYRLFKKLGCITCHNGINIGGNSYQKMGLIRNYRWKGDYPDRFSVTHREADKNVFKVPTLRNIVLTAPYFHDGSAETLEKALQKMAYHNLGYDLNDQEVKSLMVFLRTLTGKKPAILQTGFEK